MIQSTDIVLHHTSVTFDNHLLEIVGTLILGGQISLLHPNEYLNPRFWSETITCQQITYLNIAHSLLIIIIDYLHSINDMDSLNTLRCVSLEGKKIRLKEMFF